ncbi:MAG: hypothetical protein GEV03_29025 [Streptosporangiales bacterium]|nr:hypothetical protein [Streptosporangiales bacterium]
MAPETEPALTPSSPAMSPMVTAACSVNTNTASTWAVIRCIDTETLVTEDLLAFAGIAPVELKAIRLESQIAEKLHAYTRTYEGGRRSTRIKDLVDLALVAEFSRPDAEILREAIEATFVRRDTHPMPRTLPATRVDRAVFADSP